VLLEAKGLRKSFSGREVVSGVDLRVDAGEIVGLLGKNGAGKTTTFRMVMGILRPDAGEVVFDGKSLGRMPMYERARAGIGYLSQESSVFTGLTVEQNLLAVMETIDVGRAERSRWLDEVLTAFGLTQVRRNRASTVSGGERRRLEIARAMLTSPRLVLFDEPFSGIDPIAVFELQEVVYSLKERGIGILLTDHNVRETLAVTDRTYIMDEGRIWLEGRPEELAVNEEAKRRYLGERFSLDAVRRARIDSKPPASAGPAGDSSEAGS
jgi:lipopolysaccharide export system ATP-binding protein